MHSCILIGEELLDFGLNMEGRSPLNLIVLLFYPVIMANKLYNNSPPPIFQPHKESYAFEKTMLRFI